MMKKIKNIKLSITRKDINSGIPGDCSACPVAHSFLRELSKHYKSVRKVEVNSHHVWYWLGGKPYAVACPPKIKAFILNFDSRIGRKTVNPFKCTIDLSSARPLLYL